MSGKKETVREKEGNERMSGSRETGRVKEGKRDGVVIEKQGE